MTFDVLVELCYFGRILQLGTCSVGDAQLRGMGGLRLVVSEADDWGRRTPSYWTDMVCDVCYLVHVSLHFLSGVFLNYAYS